MAARHIEHDSDETIRETARKASDQATRSARSMADSTERTVRSGAETAERNSERMLSSWRSGTDAANRIAERSLAQFTRMFGLSGDSASQTLQQSSENLQALLQTTSLVADSMHGLFGELSQFVQDRAEHNFELLDRVMACRSPQEWLALQTQMARDHVEACLGAAKRTSERTTQVADEAVRRMAETTLAPG
jgi:hypothetical protein